MTSLRVPPLEAASWWRSGRWIAAAVAVTVSAVLFVSLTGVRPAYDAYGWLTWGREALHGSLDTSAAPSWKPLTFLFTLPFALAGPGALWLWMVTATVGAFAAPIPAARIGYRLAGGADRRGPGPLAAALFAGFGVLGLQGYWHFAMIATADPMMVTLCLGAVDCHLSRRPRPAFVLLVLAALGRPEAAVFAAVYGVWAWSAVPAMRGDVVVGWLLIAALWLGVPAITSHSWFSAGDTALAASTPLRGNKLIGVIDNFLSLYVLPMHLAALCAVILASLRRRRAELVLAAAAMVWVAIWVALAVYGWEPDPRYMFEPAAVEVVLAGAAVGQLVAVEARSTLVRVAGVTAIVVLVVSLVPVVRQRLRLAHNGIVLGRSWASQIHHLQAVIARDGGAARILACGQAATPIPFQSILAWEVGENVADIGWDLKRLTAAGRPLVIFLPHHVGWKVLPIHMRVADRAGCERLRVVTSPGRSAHLL